MSEIDNEPGGSDMSAAKPNRRKFLKTGLGITAVAGAGCAMDGFFIEPHGYVVSPVDIAVKGLPEAWAGATIAHLTDIHAGRLTGMEEVRRIVDMTNALQPDVIVITGDFVSRADSISAALVEVLRDLRPKIGAAAVLGNHDYWADGDAMKRALRSAGIPVLVNSHMFLSRDGSDLCLAGVDDLMAGRPDAAAALSGVPVESTRLLICHNPDYAEYLPADTRVDLMLCGHTHGGQIRIPFIGPLTLPVEHRKYAEGLVEGPRCPVFISRGLGMVGIPVRFNCRPEIPLITLLRT